MLLWWGNRCNNLPVLGELAVLIAQVLQRLRAVGPHFDLEVDDDIVAINKNALVDQLGHFPVFLPGLLRKLDDRVNTSADVHIVFGYNRDGPVLGCVCSSCI